jgi:hypothetical protein
MKSKTAKGMETRIEGPAQQHANSSSQTSAALAKILVNSAEAVSQRGELTAAWSCEWPPDAVSPDNSSQATW